MQRIVIVLLGLAPTALPAQQAAGAALWRLAGTTLTEPTALLMGGAAPFWNPAQSDDDATVLIGVDGIQTPSVIGAVGVIAVVRARVGGVGHLGMVYGRMGLDDLTRTSETPDPIGSGLDFFTSVAGLTWSRAVAGTTVGATLAHHDTRLDGDAAHRWTVDIGVARRVVGRLRAAAATHFLTGFRAADPAQDLYAGLEYGFWEGPLWGGRGGLIARYGVAAGHGFPADHQAGLGLVAGDRFAANVLLVREGSYAAPGWRPAAGIRVTVGRYRVSFARDLGINQIGSAYRVGVEARFR